MKVNSGNNVKFWELHWIGEEPLEKAFQRLYSVSSQKNAYISEIVDPQNPGVWNLQFRRTLYSWEETHLTNLQATLNEV